MAGTGTAQPRIRLALLWFRIPVVIAVWLLGYGAPWLPGGSGNTWLGAAAWAAAHGLHDLESGTRVVTVTVTFFAVLGATLRVIHAVRWNQSRAAEAGGFFLTGASLSVLMPIQGAGMYLAVLAAVSLAGWWYRRPTDLVHRAKPPVWQRLLSEAFPIFAAGCFLTMSWQYNAQWLIRGLLVSAGAALLARAAFPWKEAASR